MGLRYGEIYQVPKDVTVKEIYCKQALSRSLLEADFALNPYRGCSHGCIYCYSPYVIREERRWGDFVDIKRDIPKLLSEELNRKEGSVRLSSVTDPYQPVEKSYEITRMCLEQLKRKGVHTIIQTKSDLVTRDIDLFCDMEVDVGMTITSLDDGFSRIFEPGAPNPDLRMKALEKLVEKGINTWAFIGPLIPGFNDSDDAIKKIVRELNDIGVSEIYLDKLNIRDGIWKKFEASLDEQSLRNLKKVYEDKDYFLRRKRFYSRLGKPVY